VPYGPTFRAETTYSGESNQRAADGRGGVAIQNMVAPDNRSGGALVAELAGLLATAPSGLAFVYRCLDELVERWNLNDAMLILDTPATGRQVFRARRRPVEGRWAGTLAANGGRGLHTDPVLLEPDVAEGVVGLCDVALRLDVLDHDATHDPLTGLLNRRSFERLLAQALGRSRRYGWPFSLVMLDLNRFKALNDRHGHAAGDRVLRLVGSVLRSSLRAGDAAARMGGDEFAVLLNRGDQRSGTGLATRVATLVNGDFDWADIGFAVGVATAPAETVDAEELYRLADARLYEAKVG
jgi:diguanylate cyclase (GGDEF)-like protein